MQSPMEFFLYISTKRFQYELLAALFYKISISYSYTIRLERYPGEQKTLTTREQWSIEINATVRLNYMPRACQGIEKILPWNTPRGDIINELISQQNFKKDRKVGWQVIIYI